MGSFVLDDLSRSREGIGLCHMDDNLKRTIHSKIPISFAVSLVLTDCTTALNY